MLSLPGRRFWSPMCSITVLKVSFEAVRWTVISPPTHSLSFSLSLPLFPFFLPPEAIFYSFQFQEVDLIFISANLTAECWFFF